MADGTLPSIVRRSDALLVREIRSESRECDFIASTDSIDSYDEIVDQKSWDLRRYVGNPIVLYQHDRMGLPIGQCSRCEVVNGQLECTIKFASPEANPEAERVWRLIQERVLRAVSVGFKPKDGKYEMRDGRDVYVLYGCELREISVVTVPANPDCLSQMKADALALLDAPTRERIGRGALVRTLAGAVAGIGAPRATTHTSSAPAAAEKAAPEALPVHENAAAGGTTEKKTMPTIEEMQARIDQLTANEKSALDARSTAEKALADVNAKLATAEAERATLVSTNETLTKEHTKACEDRDAATARAKAAEDKLIGIEVDALIGKKIAPTEREDFVKLRTDSPELFKSMVDKRPDMKATEPVIAAKADDMAPPVLSPESGEKAATFWAKL